MGDVPRRYGQPLIVPPEGGEPIVYRRVSTMAKVLDDQSNLIAWAQRKTAQGLALRADLQTRLAGLLAMGDPDDDPDARKALNTLCREASEAAGGTRGASAGTGFHQLTEAVDRGQEPLFVPDADRVRLEAYREATKDLEVVEVERFVVNDLLHVAGTYDRLWLCPDGQVRVGDLKTGKWDLEYPTAAALQMAFYANGMHYDPDTAEREWLDTRLDRSAGLLIHLPATGGCEVRVLDLDRGYWAARVAMDAKVVQGWKAKDLDVTDMFAWAS